MNCLGREEAANQVGGGVGEQGHVLVDGHPHSCLHLFMALPHFPLFLLKKIFMFILKAEILASGRNLHVYVGELPLKPRRRRNN